jgi:prevent-host-death family protein
MLDAILSNLLLPVCSTLPALTATARRRWGTSDQLDQFAGAGHILLRPGVFDVRGDGALMPINLYEAKTKLSELVERAAAGEEIVIAKAGKPKAKLVPLTPRTEPRKPGVWKGRLWIAQDFDAPLPDDILAAFEGRDEEPPA